MLVLHRTDRPEQPSLAAMRTHEQVVGGGERQHVAQQLRIAAHALVGAVLRLLGSPGNAALLAVQALVMVDPQLAQQQLHQAGQQLHALLRCRAPQPRRISKLYQLRHRLSSSVGFWPLCRHAA